MARRRLVACWNLASELILMQASGVIVSVDPDEQVGSTPT